MENRLAENCRAFSAARNKLLDKVIVKLPISAEYSSTFHSVTLATSVICIVAIYSQIRALTLFSLHPTCMIIGCFVFLSEGIVAYRNRSLLETLSPIMQHNKKTKVCTAMPCAITSLGILRDRNVTDGISNHRRVRFIGHYKQLVLPSCVWVFCSLLLTK